MFKRDRLRTAEDVAKLRENALLVSSTLAELATLIKPGITTLALDKVAHDFICDHGAKPGFLGYGGFPYTLCISVNDVVVHGFPSDYELKEGDVVSIDCGTIKHGFYGDSAFTFGVGQLSEADAQLVAVTRESLERGIAAAVSGNRTGDIGHAVQGYVEQFGYGVVREYVGHGVGRSMHERPEVPNYGKLGQGVLLRPGLSICIEPMVTAGSYSVSVADNGWEVRTVDHKKAAHFEKTLVVTGHGAPDVLTDYGVIDQALARVQGA